LDLEIRTDSTLKPVVTQPADIPNHTYILQGRPSQVLKDLEALQGLALQVEKTVEADLQAYDIRDNTTLTSLHSRLYQAAALRKDRKAVLRHLGELRETLDNPVRKALTGLLVECYLEALERPGSHFHPTFRALLSRRLEALPEAARAALPTIAQSLQGQTQASLAEATSLRLDGQTKDGRLDEAQAAALLNAAVNYHLLLPVKEDVLQVLNQAVDYPKPPHHRKT
jgi:hypothetical protein